MYVFAFGLGKGVPISTVFASYIASNKPSRSHAIEIIKFKFEGYVAEQNTKNNSLCIHNL